MNNLCTCNTQHCAQHAWTQQPTAHTGIEVEVSLLRAIETLQNRISSLEAKLAIAKEALRWYAVDDNPAGCQTARNALSRLNGEER